jgi:hypothetical protein
MIIALATNKKIPKKKIVFFLGKIFNSQTFNKNKIKIAIFVCMV